MNPKSRARNPESDEAEQSRVRPSGPDETAEPDGQFPNDDSSVGTIEPGPGEDPVAETDPNREEGSLAEDPNGIEQVAGLRRESEAETGRPGAEAGGVSSRGTGDQRPTDKPDVASDRKAEMGVTTDPRDREAGGGGNVPLGSGDDSRTWGPSTDQKGADKSSASNRKH